jgi:hypothetical protein
MGCHSGMQVHCCKRANREKNKMREGRYLVVGEGEQLLPQAIAVLFGPLLGKEVHDLVASADEGVAVAPYRVRRVGHLDRFWVSIGENGKSITWTVRSRVGKNCMYLVFHASCAAFTLIRAVSRVKGGKGGFASEVC